MANVYFQIRCGNSYKNMVVGREYDFAVGDYHSKLSPTDVLDFLEKATQDAFREKYGELYELEGAIKEEVP